MAAAEKAEDAGVQDALKELLNNANNTSPSPPGLLGQVSVHTEAGPVQVSALSIESLADADGPAEISAAETGGIGAG